MADNNVALSGAMNAATGVLGGLIGSGQKLPVEDLAALVSQIQQSGQDQRSLINQYPVAIQQQIQQYMATANAGTTNYQNQVAGQGAALTTGMNSIYGPNSDAANAEKVADKASIYSTVPGTEDAIRNAMAATGGLARGNAGVALAQPYMQAAQQNGTAAMGVDAKQTAAAQTASQTALMAVNSMNANMFQQTYGMSQDQAKQILSSGNAALSTQLADLINQSNTETGQMLSVDGIAAQNGYNNAVTRNEQQGAIYNGLVDMGLQGAKAAFA